jgi:hypothetical protein
MKSNIKTRLYGPNWEGTRCEARTRRGTPCERPGNKTNGRCKFHGGRSTGTRTEEGKASVYSLYLLHPFRLYAGLWHSVLRRVFAPHLSPGHSGPNRVARPNSEISFVTVIFTPIMECYIITYFSTSFKCSRLVFY